MKRKKSATLAQQWAQKRNGCKFLLKGVLGNLEHSRCAHPLTDFEAVLVEEAEAAIGVLLDEWDENNAKSKEDFLNGK